MEVFRAFPKDAEDFAGFAKTRLQMPMLIKGRGHWLMEEAPDQVIPKLVEFLNRQEGGSTAGAVCDRDAKKCGQRALIDAACLNCRRGQWAPVAIFDPES